MNRIKIALLTLLLVSQPIQAKNAAIKLCYENESVFPWLVKGGYGVSNYMMDMAAALSGVGIEQVAMPWKRCLASIEDGSSAGGFNASFNTERATYAAYPMANGELDVSRRTDYGSYSLYRRKGDKVSWDGKQLAHLTGPIGAPLGYSVIPHLKKAGAKVEETGGSADILMKMLILGNFQLLALLTPEGDRHLGDSKLRGIVEKITPPFSEKPYFLIFNKDYYNKNPAAANGLWSAVATARESAAIKALTKERMKN